MGIAQKHSTAILLFANSSQEELKHKPIRQGRHLFNALTEHTLGLVQSSKLPYFHFSEEEQKGDTFGERFVSAIKTVFDQGYEHIITLGNDTPQLELSHILEAHSKLQYQKFVLGPSQDGGFYLMGLHKSQFDADQFQRFSWQTSHLIEEVSSFAGSKGAEVIWLSSLFDVDSLIDIKKLLRHSHGLSKRLLHLFHRLLRGSTLILSACRMLIDSLLLKNHLNKGSPYYSL
ncbi:TIGR04282 family arsenosugar biosynthesis glycosyltransferase [Spongiimicrobium salis]|uniref:TIGR04282 family arsenosugar biosynthesis glycosyltransferase n=1 Tax=Spongiimicrobium salis TaxID=1667022 RepID=UPI00374D4E8A